MYTQFDKALVAGIVGILTLVGLFVPSVSKWADPATIATVVAVATPLLVYLFPNLPKDT